MHSENKVTKEVRLWDGIGIGKALILVAVVIITIVFCEWPDLHPETYFGADYHWWLDMVFHGGYYLLVTIFLYVVFCKGRQTGIFWITVLMTSYAFEGMQAFIPGRTASILDLASNFLGISIGTLLCIAFYR
jgi:VanZ family protein